jgi:cytoskeleton protein RodZ
MQVDADSLGSYLRRERELREMSLQDISSATKIQLKFLEALERDDYDQLPPAPFVVGFLRAYAQCVSLVPEEIIATYYARHGVSEGDEGTPLLVAYQVRRPTRSRLFGVSLLVVVGVLVVGLALQLLIRESSMEKTPPITPVSRERSAENTPTSETLSPTVSNVPHAPSTEASSPVSETPVAVVQDVKPEPRPTPSLPAASAVSTPLRSTPGEHAAAAPAVQLLTLQATAVEDTWLRVEIDGNKRYDVLLTSGKTAQWEGQKLFLLTIGNARGTRLMLNGQDIPLPSARSNVVRDFQITRQLLE